MAPLKFEDDIREKLQEREINPSKSSWDRLSGELDQVNNKRNTKRYTWMGIAASFVGFLVVSTLWLMDNSNSSSIKIVQNSQEKKTTQPNGNEEKVNKMFEDVEFEKTEIVNEPSSTIKEKKSSQVALEKTENRILKKEKDPETLMSSGIDSVGLNEALASSEPKETPVIPDNNIDSKIDQKIDAVVAELQAIKEKNNSVSDEEINQLILEAQKEIAYERMLNQDHKINALSLLEQVEYELDETFKQKVLEALKAGFNKVKTAVAERNQ